MLTNREIVPKQSLRILIDSEYLNRLLSKPDKNSQVKQFLEYHGDSSLNYHGNSFLEFLRTQAKTEHPELQAIPEVTLHHNEQGQLTNLKTYISHESACITSFGYSATTIEDLGVRIFNVQKLNQSQTNTIILVLIQATFQNLDSPSHNDDLADTGILITDKKILLEKRLWFESKFPGGILNIVTFTEAMEIFSLFLKYRKKYYLIHHYKFDKRSYYWHLFRSKISHFHVESNLSAFSQRFVFLLMSVDEIGFQYYSGVNISSMESSIYHFNYFIILITGIFDSLAIRTNEQYDLDCEKGEISLNSKSGKGFRQALRKRNKNLYNHINLDSQFIQLIYQFRDEIIHRDMLQQASFGSQGDNEKWGMNFIKIDNDTKERLKHYKDKKVKYQMVTEWGLHTLGTHHFLEPFSFAKMATKKMVIFSNTYLELLGFNSFLSESESNGEPHDSIHKLNLFSRFDWGF